MFAWTAAGDRIPYRARSDGGRDGIVAGRAPQLAQRVAEIEAVIAALPQLENADPSRLVLAGHSFGAATALLAARKIGCDQVIMLDTWAAPIPEAVLKDEAKLPKQVLSLCSVAFANDRDPNTFAPLAESAIPTFLDPSTEQHTWFSDVAILLPTVPDPGCAA